MFLLVFRKKINTVILIHKGKLVFLRTEQKIKNQGTKDGPISVDDGCVFFNI